MAAGPLFIVAVYSVRMGIFRVGNGCEGWIAKRARATHIDYQPTEQSFLLLRCMLRAFFPSNKLPMRPREASSLHRSLLLGKKASNRHPGSNKLRD